MRHGAAARRRPRRKGQDCCERRAARPAPQSGRGGRVLALAHRRAPSPATRRRPRASSAAITPARSAAERFWLSFCLPSSRRSSISNATMPRTSPRRALSDSRSSVQGGLGARPASIVPLSAASAAVAAASPSAGAARRSHGPRRSSRSAPARCPRTSRARRRRAAPGTRPAPRGPGAKRRQIGLARATCAISVPSGPRPRSSTNGRCAASGAPSSPPTTSRPKLCASIRSWSRPSAPCGKGEVAGDVHGAGRARGLTRRAASRGLRARSRALRASTSGSGRNGGRTRRQAGIAQPVGDQMLHHRDQRPQLQHLAHRGQRVLLRRRARPAPRSKSS